MQANLLEASEAARIATTLAMKYGSDALGYVRARAERAQEVGDDLAYDAWLCVLDATESLLEL